MDISREVLAIRLTEERDRIGYTQAGFAKQIGISPETLRRYELGQREAGIEFLAKTALFGIDVQYVLTGIKSKNIDAIEKSPQPIINVESGGAANVIQNANAGSIINFNQKYTQTTKVEVKPDDEHISQEQASTLTRLVNDIFSLEAQVRQKPKTHRAIWAALNAHCGVTRYLLIAKYDYPKAEKYLRMWIGRLSSQKAAPVVDNHEWRKRRYAYIKINTKNDASWLEAYMQRNFDTQSLSDLSDDDLLKVYKAVASKRQRVKKTVESSE